MADDFAALKAWADKMEAIASPAAAGRISKAGAEAARKAALEAASKSLGGDRRFRNFPKAGALDARIGSGGARTEVVLTGPWSLAESGRRSRGVIKPKRRRALRVPGGLRSRSRYGPSRGKRTATEASRQAQTTVPKAAHDQFVQEIERAR
jgi:hypothetical protein